MNLNAIKIVLLFFAAILAVSCFFVQIDFGADYFKIHFNNKGFITSMKNITVKPNREFNTADNLSPLLCL